ncbi:exodeoxyribonuclease VII large subunit [Stieleria sp. ICT_E10.1]|uniref:exodeoxyribonuclease VII large subunit n=1 Tax=Stieleria sedimenti TaxID=2976331 RepID=UPI0021803D20|nr:exodeoxyribonuclease VII large subunit [Stieleria sedimenti]MCS7465335.1 exodeoxyribonuclease VII large subunit [Stieleria sedimenti]
MNESFESESDALTQAVSVSELNHQLKAVVEGTFPMMWVAGEVTDVAKPRSGHIYFTLKDDDSQIRAVMWRNVASRLKFDLENGQSILCFGGLEIYTVRGTYQIVVRKAQPQGVGTLQLAFEKLKARLNAEGLFSYERKQPLPSHPRRIGVITSPSGAAVHDFLVAAENRMIGAEIFVIPAQVQGSGAAETIVRGLKAAAMIRPKLDVVVVARGGGSLEDLWCFNEEAVVRAIAQCPVPTVSAVGHEVDVTLSDLAADVRALTPTDAATKVFADRSGIVQRVNDLTRRLHRVMQYELERRQVALDVLANHPAMSKPMEMVHLRSRLVDELDQRAKQAIDRRLQQSKSDVATLAASLAALSPLNTLARGYSVTSDSDGNAISDASRLEIGERVTTRLASGSFESVVDKINSE